MSGAKSRVEPYSPQIGLRNGASGRSGDGTGAFIAGESMFGLKKSVAKMKEKPQNSKTMRTSKKVSSALGLRDLLQMVLRHSHQTCVQKLATTIPDRRPAVKLEQVTSGGARTMAACGWSAPGLQHGHHVCGLRPSLWCELSVRNGAKSDENNPNTSKEVQR